MGATEIKEGLRRYITDIKSTSHHIGGCVCIYLSEGEYMRHCGALGWNGCWGTLIYICCYCGGLGDAGGACHKGCAATSGP